MQSRRIGLTIAVVLTLVSGALALGQRAGARQLRIRVPTSGALLGAYAQPTDWSKAGQQAAVASLESSIGRPLAIDHLFYKWTADFITWRQTWDVANGRIPMVSWGRVPSTEVISGSQDPLIVQRAREVASFGQPIFIRWSAGMDGASNAGVTGTPAQFVAAWQRIHDLFFANGATNAEWVWCPNSYAFGTGAAQTYYPGDSYVDWDCADGYNWSPLKAGGASGGAWRSFSDIFAPFYAWSSKTGKPLMIGETGAQEGGAGDKARWISGILAAMQQYPAIKALVYFDGVAGSASGGSFDWRIASSPSSLAAFKSIATSSYFLPTSPPPTSDPSTSDPSTSNPSTSNPSSSDPPTSDPPTSDPSTSNPPTSDPPTSDPPTSDPPTSPPPTSPPPTSSLTLWDASCATYTHIPQNAQMVAGGPCWTPAIFAYFPNAIDVHIALVATDYAPSVVDVEAKFVQVSQVRSWLIGHQALGTGIGTVYVWQGNLPAIRTALSGLNYHLWIADQTGVEHAWPGAIATQWCGYGGAGRCPGPDGAYIDESLVTDPGALTEGS